MTLFGGSLGQATLGVIVAVCVNGTEPLALTQIPQRKIAYKTKNGPQAGRFLFRIARNLERAKGFEPSTPTLIVAV